MGLQVDVLRRLRRIAEEQRGVFRSEGFRRFFAMLEEELSDEYLATVDEHLEELQFKRGLLETALLGKGFKGRDYVVRRERGRSLGERLVRTRRRAATASRSIRATSPARALSRSCAPAASTTWRTPSGSPPTTSSRFFAMLKLELAFYLGCLNLHDGSARRASRSAFRSRSRPARRPSSREGLYDVALSLHLDERTVGNDVDAAGKSLVFLTGANQGGKSTLLRAWASRS